MAEVPQSTKAVATAAGAALLGVLQYKMMKSSGCPMGGKKSEKPETKAASDDLGARSTTSSTGGGPAAYETQKAVYEYLQFHFGLDSDQMPYAFGPRDALNFTARVARLGEPYITRVPGKKIRAIDIGCAVGGASFELAKWCDEVVGIDFSQSFVRVADMMRLGGELTYTMVEEGEITVERVARRPDIDPAKITFEEGDACNIGAHLGTFDLVIAVNLLCRLPQPIKFLERLSTLVAAGGIVVLVSPHSWLPGWTAKAEWIGGYVDSQGKPHHTADGVAAVLSKDFTLLHTEDVPFLIREHIRKFQYGVSHGSVWRRK